MRFKDPALKWLLASAVLSGARASLIASQDEYLVSGHAALAFTSFARHYLIGFVGLLVPIAVVSLVGRRLTGLARGAFFLVSAGLGHAFVSCRLPELAYPMPGFDGTAAIAAHLVTASLALGVSAWLTYSSPEFHRAGKRLAAATLLLSLVLLPASSVMTRSKGSWPTSPNVILISLDTLRTDRLSAYGYERNTTPAIDGFAERSMRFTRAHAPHPWTLTSHMSMLTGLSPREHGVSESAGLSNSIPTLAELYSEAGYETVALVDSVTWLDQRFGFDRGFASYRRVSGSAQAKIEMLDQVLNDLNDGPFFLFLHFFDAHSGEEGLPYDSDHEDFERWCDWYEGEFVGCGADGLCASRFLSALNAGKAGVDAPTGRYISDLYDAGVRSMDRQLAELFAKLDERGLFGNSVVILTSDHGEELGDHGKYLHGTHFQECVSVPLLVRTPDVPLRSTSDLLVSHADLAPTLLELCGLGTDLVGGSSYAAEILLGQDPNQHDHVFFDSGHGLPGVRWGDWKWTGGQNQSSLFNLADDPHELHDLSESNPAQVRRLRALSEQEFDRLSSVASARRKPSETVDLSSEARRTLESLGYTGDE